MIGDSDDPVGGDPPVSSVNSVNSPVVFPRGGAAPIPVPAFPLDVLPGPMRKLTEEGAATLGVPPDLIAVPQLTFAGATIGNTCRIQLKPGFEQYPTLYAGTIAPPGATKSPALDLARYPLDVLQKEAFNKQGKSAPPSIDPPTGHSKSKEHYFSTDATTEAIAEMLTYSAGLVLIRDELVGWVKLFDAYRAGRGGDRQNWLSLWSAASLKVDRKTADPIYVPNPVVCVCGGIQPDVLPQLAQEAGRRDGFIERILWAYPETKTSLWTESTVPQGTKDAAVELFRKLRQDNQQTVTLSAPATALWVPWYNSNAKLVEGAVGLIAGVYAKLPNQAARIAPILHCLSHPNSPSGMPVDATTMSAALELAEYFRGHAIKTMPHFGIAAIAPSGGLAVRARAVLRKAAPTWVDRTQLHIQLGGHATAADLDQAVSDLKSLGLAEDRTVSAGPAGGRPSEQWRAKPIGEETEDTEETTKPQAQVP